VEHARVALDQLVDERVTKHRVDEPVHVQDRAWRELTCLAQRADHVTHVPGLHLGQ
jgi:hypothetical protein